MLWLLATMPLWVIVLTQLPAVAWIFVGLGLFCAAFLLLAALSASVNGVAHEAYAMWRPVFAWLPWWMRDNLYIRIALGALAFMVLNVTLHWLLRP